MGERSNRTAEVRGSIPLVSTRPMFLAPCGLPDRQPFAYPFLGRSRASCATLATRLPSSA